ncbi:MAG: DUF6089 family protein [Flavobacteriaceae bacterium]
MKTLYFSLIFILSTNLGISQIYEIGIIGGGTNVIGDVGSTTFVAPKKLAIGGIIRWNRSPRHSYRASVIYTTLFGNDNLSSDPKREIRGYYFNARSLEVSAGMEFTFLDFDLHRRSFNFSPYLYTGVSMLNHPNFYYANNVLVSEKTRSNAYGIPIALGVKVTLTDHIIFGMEVAARYTFSDELDGSVPDTKELKKLRFGNINNTDWYVFSGITLTYTFGRNPCFCNY